MNELTDHQKRSAFKSGRRFQYACGVSGILCPLLVLAALGAAGFLPPPRPSWNAEQTVKHYRDHEKGIQAAAALLVLSTLFYLLFTAAISAQLQSAPDVHPAVSALQLAAGAAGICTIVMPGTILAVAVYRLDRAVEITETLNDLIWIIAVMAWPTFMAQNIAIAYAVLFSCRLKRLFPRPLAIFNIALPVASLPATVAVHCVKTGPLAWDGAISFWLPACAWFVQIVLDSACLVRAAIIETEQD